MAQAFDMVRQAGAVTLVGMPPKDVQLTPLALRAIVSGQRLSGSVAGGPQFLGDINDGVEMLRRAGEVRTVVV